MRRIVPFSAGLPDLLEGCLHNNTLSYVEMEQAINLLTVRLSALYGYFYVYACMANLSAQHRIFFFLPILALPSPHCPPASELLSQ